MFTFTATACPSFTLHVTIVVGTSAKKEMIRIDTQRVVAMMADTQICGYLSKMNHPGYTVGTFCFSVLSACIDDTIAKIAGCVPTGSGR